MELKDVVVVAANRSPMGLFGGTLREIPAYDVGGQVIKKTLDKAGLKPEDIDMTVFGNCRQAGNGVNPARTAAQKAGIPMDRYAQTVNCACPTGVKATIIASQDIRLGDAEIIVAGGMDSNIYKADVAYYWGMEPFDFYVSTETLLVAMQAWNKKTMTFMPDSVFLEFIPYQEQPKQGNDKDYQPSTVLLNEVEEGQLYEVIITQFYGLPLLRYRLNDIIKIISLKDEETGVNLPQIVIRGKVGETISLAGLAELDEKTIWQAIANTGIKYTDWSASKEYDQNQSFLRLSLELKEEMEAAELETMIDEQLKIVDTDYSDIDSYLGRRPVRITLLSQGTFERYMEEKRKEGADLAFLKPTHVNAPGAAIERLLELSEASSKK